MIFLSDDDVLELAKPADLIAAMDQAFAASDEMPARLHCDLPGDDDAKLLVMPAWLGREAIGVKVATVMPRNGGQGRPTVGGLYVLLNGVNGQPRAVISAAALTAVRTAAVSGLAARYLARSDAKTLLMVGTGALAPHLIRAHAAVRTFDKVLVWGRNASKAWAIANEIDGLVPSIEVTTCLADSIAEADIISAATATTTPLILGEGVKPGTHIDLVGSFTPEMREADMTLFSTGRLIVDTPRAFAESGDLIAPATEGMIRPNTTPSLSELVRDASLKRTNDSEITIFKTVGTGLADIVAASRLYDLSIAHNSPVGDVRLHHAASSEDSP